MLCRGGVDAPSSSSASSTPNEGGKDDKDDAPQEGASSSSGASSTPDEGGKDDTPQEGAVLTDTSTGRSYVVQADTSTVKLSAAADSDTALTIVEDQILTIDGRSYTVVGVAPAAFSHASKLASVSFPLSLCGDMNAAIGQSQNDLDITITGSGTVPNNAFNLNKKIASLRFGEGIKGLGTNAFSYCSTLTSVKDWGGVTSLSEYTFTGSGLETLRIPAQMETVASSSFYYCKKLSCLVLEEGVKTIEAAAFGDCTGLTAIYFPKTIETMEPYAFANCIKLTEGESGGIYYAGKEEAWTALGQKLADKDVWQYVFDQWPSARCQQTVPTLGTEQSGLLSLLL